MDASVTCKLPPSLRVIDCRVQGALPSDVTGDDEDEFEELPQFNVSYKPQKISPKFEGTVRQLLHKRIRESYIHPQVGCTACGRGGDLCRLTYKQTAMPNGSPDWRELALLWAALVYRLGRAVAEVGHWPGAVDVVVPREFVMRGWSRILEFTGTYFYKQNGGFALLRWVKCG